MLALTAIQRLNRDLADKLIEEAKRNSSAFVGTFVGIVNGKVVVTTDGLDELSRRLRQADPDPASGFWFEVGRDYNEVHEIWEVPGCRPPIGFRRRPAFTEYPRWPAGG
jgi:hypothetical protein